MASYGSEKEASPKAAAVALPELKELVDWYDQWEERTRKDREESARDYDYYDNLQWTQDEIDALEERGQPVLTKNRIARKVNFILGDEVEKGVDPIALPRNPTHTDDARAATDALRATEEGQDFDACRSAVFKDALIAGYGGAIIEGDPDPESDTCAPLTHVAWDRLWWDPHSTRSDFSDAKYRGVVIWQDLDDAITDYPDAKEALEAAVNQSRALSASDEDKPRQWAEGGKRKRVKICEAYFHVGGRHYRACFTEAALLRKPEPTGYVDRRGNDVCPLPMMSCYVRSKDNARYGIVRALISPQDEINKRDSKALHLISVNGVTAERDSVRDPEKFMRELAKPDGYAEVEPGRLADGSVLVRNGVELAASQTNLAQQARADIDGIGPSSATMPDIPQSASGKAFIARQKAAAKELAPVFASLRRWDLEVMRQDWMRIVQFRTDEWWTRVTDDQEETGHRFVALNRQVSRAERLQELLQKGVALESALTTAAGNAAPQVLQESQMYAQQAAQQLQQTQQLAQQGGPPAPAQPAPDINALILQHPLMQEIVTVNQAAQMGVDIMIDESPESAIVEEEEFDSIAQLLPTVVQARPDLAPVMVKALIKASQMRAKREILKEIDKPADPQQAQLQQAQQQLQMEDAKAGVGVKQSQAALNAARAAGEQAKAAKVPSEIEKNQASAMREAAQAGQTAAGPGPGEQIQDGFEQAQVV